MLGCHHQRRHAEYLRSGERVDVIAAPKSFHQQWVFREMRQQAQFDLRVVGGQQDVAGFGGEGGANFAAQFGADRNVLQVRIGRRQASGRGSGLPEGRMQTSAARD